MTVTVNGDTLDEANETYLVTLSNPTNATILDGQGLGTITDDDTPPTVSVNDVTVTEGNSGNVNATFNVSLSTASGQAVSVNYATADGTATAPADYAATSGTLNFAAGETTQAGDRPRPRRHARRGERDVHAQPVEPVQRDDRGRDGVGTITDDDAQPTLSINNVTVTEGDSGTVNATFTVSLSAASGQNVTVDYATADGTATAPADYTATSGTLTFTAGQISKQVTVLVKATHSTSWTRRSRSTSRTRPTRRSRTGPGIGTITDDDDPPSLSVNDVTVTEGDSGTTNANFTVTLSAASGQTVTVQYATADGTATAPADYTATSGDAYLHTRADDEDRQRPDRRRHARRGGRDVHARPHGPDERHDRRRSRAGHDHRRRPAAESVRRTTSP